MSGRTSRLRQNQVGAEARWRMILLAAALTMLSAVLGIGIVVAIVSRSRIEAFGWFTLVIGGWIPTPLGTMAVLTFVGLALLVSGVLLAPPPARRLPAAVRVVIGVLLTVGVPVSLVAVVLFGNNSFRVLPEVSDGGCRIVVQSDWIGGTVGIVQPGSATVGWTRDWSGDDFSNPFSSGTYSMTWQNRVGHLTVWGDAMNPASWDDRNSALSCRR
ncbi:MAG: hypothetical protein JWR01_2333 [Subtercola sp.]|nr:hypothetical protein [Subtercola sp.]